MVFPLTPTRPDAIQCRASVREPRPAFEMTRSRVFKGRFALGLEAGARIPKNYSNMIGESQLNLSSEKILVRGARQVITLQGPDGPRRGAALSELGMIRDGALLLEGGKVLQMGPSRRLENVAAARGAREINAAGRVVIPGFVDCRMQPLIPIAKPGPPGSLAPDAPFWRSLEELAALPSGRLQARVQTMLARMVRHGTTTASPGVIPAPSRSAAAKLLRIFAGADSRPMSIIPALC